MAIKYRGCKISTMEISPTSRYRYDSTTTAIIESLDFIGFYEELIFGEITEKEAVNECMGIIDDYLDGYEDYPYVHMED